MRIVNRRDLTWKGFELYFKRRKLLEVVQDETYPTMWRVKHRDGRLSDMVNLTRAQDAALHLALAMLDPRRDVHRSPPGAPYSDLNGEPVPEVA